MEYNSNTIELKFIPCTNTRGARVKATSHHLEKSRILSWDDGASNGKDHTNEMIAILENAIGLNALWSAHTKEGEIAIFDIGLDNWKIIKQFFGINN